MVEDHKRDQEPWHPLIEREPQLNPFANVLSPSGESDHPVSLPELDAEEETSVAGVQAESKAASSEEPVPVEEIRPAQ